MKSLYLASFFGFVAASCAQSTVWLCGDSTMAPGGGHNGTQGWGEYLRYSLSPSIRVNNSAYAGRSARTFTREGRFQAIIDVVKPGDWVVIEFGKNDQGDPATDIKYRVDCPGLGPETCPVTYNNETEIVQTYVTYIKNASSIFLSRGAKVIISSPIPNNPYFTGNDTWNPAPFSYYSWYIASSLGGPEKGIYYANHFDYAAQVIKNVGVDVTNANFPMDQTHLSPHFADLFSQAFVLAVKCGTAPFQRYIVNATSRIEGSVMGTCLPVNATLPI
ncbi:GDSL-like Lipase/Acylhydrolase [Thozetella sp. PMI_491]|nr:GDSL-like Lipase/Acylhydrolase [Thozetella sp. PMI_491]